MTPYSPQYWFSETDPAVVPVLAGRVEARWAMPCPAGSCSAGRSGAWAAAGSQRPPSPFQTGPRSCPRAPQHAPECGLDAAAALLPAILMLRTVPGILRMTTTLYAKFVTCQQGPPGSAAALPLRLRPQPGLVRPGRACAAPQTHDTVALRAGMIRTPLDSAFPCGNNGADYPTLHEQGPCHFRDSGGCRLSAAMDPAWRHARIQNGTISQQKCCKYV